MSNIRKPKACLVAMSLAVLAVGGCGRGLLSVSDAVRMEGVETLLSAYAERTDVLGSWDAVEGVEVSFFVDGTQVGRALSDASGYAGLRIEIDPAAQRFEARATIDGGQVKHEGHIFHWPADRTIVVCDIDGTISWTDFGKLYVEMSNEGTVPIEDARDTLAKISERFNVAYLSARPRVLLPLTKQWLADHDFPPGPVITASNIDEGIHAEHFKAKAIRAHKQVVPQILIGIGNLESDAEAYGSTGLLPLIRHKHDDKQFRADAIVLPDWPAIGEFFEANADLLEDPGRLSKAIDEREMLLQRPFPYQPRK